MRSGPLDALTVHVERAADGDTTGSAALCAELARRIKNRIGITAGVHLHDPGAIERSIGKAKRVVDRRSPA
jgi:phenylacetate-CoA ligase